MTALYNEIDPYAADWLENLVRAGQIAPGIVDRRSIEDLEPDYVRCFTQVHLFAGLGLWSLGLRRAGWADDRPIWTGSCPCQPFSAAGQGGGFADERHLWPAYFHLVKECRPDVVAGEQVASSDGLAWLDLVSTDLEAENYAVGAVDTCAAGFGSPNIRQRLYWVGRTLADTSRSGPTGSGGRGDAQEQRVAKRSVLGLLAHPHDTLRGPDVPAGDHAARYDAGRAQGASDLGAGGGRGGLADASAVDCKRPGPVNGLWRDADWLFCRDEKWRPVEPGSFPLVDALPRGMGTMGAGLSGLAALVGADAGSLKRAKAFRTGTLRGFGNGLNLEQVTAFCEALV